MLGAGANYNFDWSVISQNRGILLRALAVTFKISITAEVLALVVGLIVAILKVQKSPIIRFPATLFVDAFRAVPLLVLLIWLYYGLSIVFGLDFSAFQAGVLGLGLLYGANIAEIFRSGLQAIPPGQREAALTLGMSRWQTAYTVVIPQAVRIVIPALANTFIGMMKDATLVSILGLNEIMRTAQNVVINTFRPFEVYTFVAGVYLVLVLIFSRLVALLERRVPVR